ncbi:hypothetical protein BLNAU_24587 [Blattamonas nauphoetae]|uniref:Uncharacterized protein n=1 Tax=Blattamonas nauphoetae TaxID=2049346 RepID=A0ABQ9WM01_9EUKA|nr:hypothetical protein BLNAU_24587 [Blattamonas nauphoetae]
MRISEGSQRGQDQHHGPEDAPHNHQPFLLLPIPTMTTKKTQTIQVMLMVLIRSQFHAETTLSLVRATSTDFCCSPPSEQAAPVIRIRSDAAMKGWTETRALNDELGGGLSVDFNENDASGEVKRCDGEWKDFNWLLCGDDKQEGMKISDVHDIVGLTHLGDLNPQIGLEFGEYRTCDRSLGQQWPDLAAGSNGKELQQTYPAEPTRRIQVMIDSCVGVLKQSDFLDFDSKLTNKELSDLSHLLYQSFPTMKGNPNDTNPLKQYLFRSSTFSLFGHVIFNSQTFIDSETKVTLDFKHPILHVITGTPGMGKSASRFPFITLLMSFGVESATTTKVGEQVYVFKRKKKKLRTGTTKICMDDSDGGLSDCYTPSYLYTYDPLPADWTHLGDVSVPSVDHFPYFLQEKDEEEEHTKEEVEEEHTKEEVEEEEDEEEEDEEEEYTEEYTEEEDEEEKHTEEEDKEEVEEEEEEPAIGIYVKEPMILLKGSVIKENSVLAKGSSLCTLTVVNRLENTKWHVVDDLTFSDGLGLEPDTNYVLFTSPKGSRWKKVNTTPKTHKCYTVEYFVPKYKPQEQAALLNTLGEQTITPEHVEEAIQGVELFSFIPRFVLHSDSAMTAITQFTSAETLTNINPKDLFTDIVSHKMVHFSCPQYDCHNWYTEFATELARWIALRTFNTTMKKEYIKTLKSMSPSAEFNQQRGALFHSFVSDAILGGFHLTSPKRLLSSTKQPPPEALPKDVGLPQPIGESYVYLRNSESMRKASLPDIKKIPVEKLENFDQKWEIFFSSPMIPCDVSSATLIFRGDNVTKDSRTFISHGIQMQRPRVRNESAAKCFTFYLKPLGGNNAGFDSVLLFFKVHKERDGLKIDDLCVMFIQSTLAKEHPISDTGANLMFLWLALLCAVYGLNQQHIHPFFFFLKQPAVKKFRLEGDYPAGSFIPEDNVWVMNCHAREQNKIILPHTERLILSATATQPNTNPTHFRCFFCDKIVRGFFPSHRCPNISLKYSEEQKTTINHNLLCQNEWLFPKPPSQTEQEQGQVTEQKQGQVTDREQGQGTAREQRHIQRITFDPVFVFNLLTPSADSDDIQSEVKGIDLGFPQVKGRIPISRKTLDEFDMLDVVMVGVEKQIEPPYYVKPTPNEQEQATLRFEVSHTRPIPNIFTYFPRRPNGPRPSQLFVETRKDVTFGHEDAKNIVKKEFKNPTSHLLTSVRLIRVWGDKQRIGFGKNKRNKVLSMGVQHPPHRDLHLLWEKKIIPLAQIHLPMNIFPKQTLSLGTRKILTPFEIRGILSLIGKKHRKKRKPMIKHWINEGQPLTQADSEPILSDEGAFSLLVDSNLRSLGTRIPTLRSLNMYELQSLVSFVSGTLTLISDTLRKCECLLESQDESSEDESDESDDDSDKSEDESDESEDDSDKSEDESDESEESLTDDLDSDESDRFHGDLIRSEPRFS